MVGSISNQAKAAGEALRRLQRTVRFFRLYPHDHKSCKQGIADTFESLTSFHRAHGPLELEVGPDGLFMDEELVLPESEAATDLVGLFYFEAIRDVLFDIGIPYEELTRLVEILSAPYTDESTGGFADDTLTNTLWREDLEYFSYQTYDPLSAGVVRSNKEDGVMGALLERISSLVDALGGSLDDDDLTQDEPEAPSSDGFLEKILEEELGVDDEAGWATNPDRALSYLDTAKGRERKRLVEELASLSDDDELERAAEVVAWSIDARHPGVRDEDAARFLSGSALFALNNGDLRQATKLASFSTVNGERTKITSLVAAQLCSVEAFQALSQHTSDKLSTLGLEYLQHLGETAVQATCDSYARVEDPRVRRVLVDFLTLYVNDKADTIATLVRHPNETIANEAVELLGSQGRDSAGFSVLMKLSKLQVGGATDKVLEMTGENERRQMVAALVESDDRESRMEALAGLAESAGRGFAPSNERLFDDLQDFLLEWNGSPGRDELEISVILDVLVLCEPKRAKNALKRVSARKLPLLRGRAEIQRLKDCARLRLEKIGGRS